jgi:sigma-B regulation protein RsbU (phosphoserine phosphatase)
MRRLLLLSLLALPLAAQYPAGAVFQRGDDLRWAAPGFDDRQWVKQSDYRANSYDDYLQNRSWLRARVTIPAGEPAVIVSQNCPCEFFMNGLRIGATGDLNQARPNAPRGVRFFPLPAGLSPGPAVFAVRRYDSPAVESVSYTWARSSALVLPASRAEQALNRFDGNVQQSGLISLCLTLAALVALLGATWGLRKDAVFWVAILMQFCLLAVVGLAHFDLTGVAGLADLSSMIWLIGAYIPIMPAVILLLILPGLRRWIWLTLCLFSVAGRIPFAVASFFAVPPSWTPLAVLLAEMCALLAVFLSLALVAFARRLGGIPLSLLLFSVGGPVFGLIGRWAPFFQLPREFLWFDMTWTWIRLGQLFYSLVVAALVIWRAGVRREQERRQQEELAAAKEVQSLLLESPPQPHPEIQIETAYLPASAVGGDFYYVRGFADGSQVALVGDVSGKGLKAASACIGSLQREDSPSPAAILAGLNRTLAGRVGGGFVTCCCVRYIPGGTVTVASAGHPAPWLDGREVALAAGLPLGIVTHAEYDEGSFALAHGQQLTLVSDGVVEAENSQRELFGFERTRAISTQSAREIAEAAKAWGQNDDITVVTVRRNA